jgi:hypothetical protein
MTASKNFRATVRYDTPTFWKRPKGQGKRYTKLMEIVGEAIKDGKQVIFDYTDDWITVKIND